MKFFKKKCTCPDCNQKFKKEPFAIKIFDKDYNFEEATRCPSCFEKYMNENCTICDHCKEVIMPFTSVGVALGEEPKHEYVHFNRECCPVGMLAFCGDWEEGKLLTLDEMEKTGRGNYRIYTMKPINK